MNFYIISAGAFFMGIVFISGVWFYGQTAEYLFCFVDQDQHLPIKDVPLEVTVILEDESPMIVNSDKNGCFEWSNDRDHVTFVVNSAYYYSDTVIRFHREHKHRETISLKTNDYALMIHYFSTSSIKDWKSRREQLDIMIAEDALIYQVMGDGLIGMEMLNKSEFIDKMTMPLSSLKNVEVLETRYTNKKISLLKFRQGGTQ